MVLLVHASVLQGGSLFTSCTVLYSIILKVRSHGAAETTLVFGVFHCVAAESVHTTVLHAAVATAVIVPKFVCFAPIYHPRK